MAVKLYEREVFHGATFADMKREGSPLVLITIGSQLLRRSHIWRPAAELYHHLTQEHPLLVLLAVALFLSAAGFFARGF